MKKVVVIALIFIILITVFGTVSKVYGASFNLETNSNTNTLKANETVTITLKATNIDAGDLGINALEGYLEYDENIFEVVTQEDFVGKNDWSITYNGENNKFLAIVSSTGITENTEIGTVTLKTKTGIEEEKNTTVKLTKIATNDGVNIIKETDKSINLKIEGKKSQTIIENTTQYAPDNTISSNGIPFAGRPETIIICIAIILAITLIILKIYRNKKLKK